MRRPFLIAWVTLTGLFPFFYGCGETSTVGIKILLADNASPNLKQQISQDIQAGQSRGVYFRFDELKFCPQSIDDLATSAQSLVVPDGSQLGSDPAKSEFEVDSSTLDPEKIYRVQMLVFDTTQSGNPTHIGTINCPLSIKYPTLNLLAVCFGNVTPSPLCSGLGSTYPLLLSSQKDCLVTPEQIQRCR